MGQAAGNAIRARASNAFGLKEAASSGRQGAWNVLNQTGAAGSAGSAPGDGAAGAPAWAQAMRSQQAARHHRQVAMHTLAQGDRGGASAHPDIKERDD